MEEEDWWRNRGRGGVEGGWGWIKDEKEKEEVGEVEEVEDEEDEEKEDGRRIKAGMEEEQ